MQDLDDCARAGCGVYRHLDRGLRILIDCVGVVAEIVIGDLDRCAEFDSHAAVLFGEHRAQSVGFSDGLANGGGEATRFGPSVEVDELTDGEHIGIRRDSMSEPQSLLR